MATDALRADAAAWNTAADELGSAAATAQARVVPMAAFSFAGTAIAESYEALRVKTEALLRDGAAYFDDIAHTLRTAADQYDADEADNAHAIQDIY